MLENPLISGRDSAQRLSWKHLKVGTQYSFEFIKPLQALVIPYSDGAYWSIAVKVLDIAQTNNLPLIKDDFIVIDIPVKTFERAWISTPLIFRKEFTSLDNLQVTFIKKSKQTIFITQIQRTKCDNQSSLFANQIYQTP